MYTVGEIVSYKGRVSFNSFLTDNTLFYSLRCEGLRKHTSKLLKTTAGIPQGFFSQKFISFPYKREDVVCQNQIKRHCSYSGHQLFDATSRIYGFLGGQNCSWQFGIAINEVATVEKSFPSQRGQNRQSFACNADEYKI